jgi:hypothetical protein
MSTTEHPLLAGIREGVQANGNHVCHWGELRREAFPAQPAWINLRAWCIDNGLECELAFGDSSREAEVHFRRIQAAPVVPPAQVASDAVGGAPSPA